MLVLSRKINEEIKVGDVTFKVLRQQGRRVKVGINAPPHMKITRGELDGPDDEPETTPEPEPTPPAAVPAELVSVP